MPKYTFYFRNGKKYALDGTSPQDALNKARFGAGAMSALDFYETEQQSSNSDYEWNAQKRTWESPRIIAQAKRDFHGADLDPSKPTKATVVGGTVVAVSQRTDLTVGTKGRNSPPTKWKPVDESGVPTSLPGRSRRSTDSGKLRREVVTVYSIKPVPRPKGMVFELDLGGRKVRSDREGAQQLSSMEPSRSGRRMCLWFNGRGTVSKVSGA